MLPELRIAGNCWELCRECKNALLQLNLLKAGDTFFPQEEKLRYQGTFLTATHDTNNAMYSKYHISLYHLHYCLDTRPSHLCRLSTELKEDLVHHDLGRGENANIPHENAIPLINICKYLHITRGCYPLPQHNPLLSLFAVYVLLCFPK